MTKRLRDDSKDIFDNIELCHIRPQYSTYIKYMVIYSSSLYTMLPKDVIVIIIDILFIIERDHYNKLTIKSKNARGDTLSHHICIKTETESIQHRSLKSDGLLEYVYIDADEACDRIRMLFPNAIKLGTKFKNHCCHIKYRIEFSFIHLYRTMRCVLQVYTTNKMTLQGCAYTLEGLGFTYRLNECLY